VETKYQSGQYFDFYNVPDSYQKSYTRTDAHLSFAPREGAWMVNAFVRNIENAIVIVDESESFAPPLSQPGTYNVGFQAPRTYGVMLSAHF
jgi:iron complex outermembrane recepter protein